MSKKAKICCVIFGALGIALFLMVRFTGVLSVPGGHVIDNAFLEKCKNMFIARSLLDYLAIAIMGFPVLFAAIQEKENIKLKRTLIIVYSVIVLGLVLMGVSTVKSVGKIECNEYKITSKQSFVLKSRKHTNRTYEIGVVRNDLNNSLSVMIFEYKFVVKKSVYDEFYEGDVVYMIYSDKMVYNVLDARKYKLDEEVGKPDKEAIKKILNGNKNK